MASQQLQDIKLSEKQAEQIIELGMSFGAYDGDEMPDSKKEKVSAANEILAHSLDAWVEDEIRPDDEEADVAEAGEQIAKVFEIAGISVDDEGNVTDAEDEEEEDDSSDDEESGEEPFDPDSYIDGYSELSVVSKLKAVKKLDIEDDDDVAVLEAIADWENEQEKPSSRVLNYVDEVLGEVEAPDEEEEADEEEEEPEDDNTDDEEEEEEPEGEELDQPWEADKKSKTKAYDQMTAVEIKKFLTEVKDAGDLTADQVEYVLEYEQAREKPAPRKRIIDFCKALLEDFANGGDEEAEEEEPEEEQPKRGRGRGRGRGRKAQAEEEEQEEAVSNGVIVLTRDQILTALESGEVEISV